MQSISVFKLVVVVLVFGLFVTLVGLIVELGVVALFVFVPIVSLVVVAKPMHFYLVDFE